VNGWTKAGIGVGAALAVVAVAGVALVGGVYGLSEAAMARTYQAHEHTVPVPWAPGEADGDAQQAAIARGEHLATVRYACVECHGDDLGGGVMVEAPEVAMAYGSNLTTGQGSVVRDYTIVDWERTIRHGVLPDGRSSFMPAQDYARLSDRELSDLVAYIRSVPPVDRDSRGVSFGPVGRALLAAGTIEFAGERFADRDEHPTEPPPAAVTVEFGQHVAAVCLGCHGHDYAGGPIAGGSPDWPPASNLTPHADGLGDWTQEQFATYLATGQHPVAGTVTQAPMSSVFKYTRQYSETEVAAIWTFLRSLPAKAGN